MNTELRHPQTNTRHPGSPVSRGEAGRIANRENEMTDRQIRLQKLAAAFGLDAEAVNAVIACAEPQSERDDSDPDPDRIGNHWAGEDAAYYANEA